MQCLVLIVVDILATPNPSVKSTVINPPKLLDQVRDKLRVKHSSSVPSKLVQIGLNAMFYSMTSVISKDSRTAQELLGHSDVLTRCGRPKL